LEILLLEPRGPCYRSAMCYSSALCSVLSKNVYPESVAGLIGMSGLTEPALPILGPLNRAQGYLLKHPYHGRRPRTWLEGSYNTVNAINVGPAATIKVICYMLLIWFQYVSSIGLGGMGGRDASRILGQFNSSVRRVPYSG